MISNDYYQITIEFTFNLDNSTWYLTNVYGPNSTKGKLEVTNWPMNLDTSTMEQWLIVGDFNLIRSPNDRNIAGGDNNNMMTMFNNIIVNHDLVEIPLGSTPEIPPTGKTRLDF